MGIYLNPGNIDFYRAVRSEIYVDKSGLINYTNQIIDTEQKFLCVSRPRRFGKSMAANMLTAYYSRGCDSAGLFQDLKAVQRPDFAKHRNRYNVIHINMQNFLTESDGMNDMIRLISRSILFDLLGEFPEVRYFDDSKLTRSLSDVFAQTKISFVFIIDEWDCVFRIHQKNTDAQKEYLDFLRLLLKDQSYVSLAYMTGILPIKKYGEHSALNMFTPVTMTNPLNCAEFTGFTEEEVQLLSERYQVSPDEIQRWYDGYDLLGLSIYNPRSVVMAMTSGVFDSYWTQTETYEALKVYIQMDYDGLRERVGRLIAGESIPVNVAKFQNDMTTFGSADDVLTLLIHLGYLTYDFYGKCCRIPNSEVRQEFINCIEDGVQYIRKKTVREYRIPFEIGGNVPNAETIEAIKEVRQMKADPSLGKTYSDVDQMMEEMLADV